MADYRVIDADGHVNEVGPDAVDWGYYLEEPYRSRVKATGVGPEDCPEQRPVAAADVDDRAEPPEVIRRNVTVPPEPVPPLRLAAHGVVFVHVTVIVFVESTLAASTPAVPKLRVLAEIVHAAWIVI